MSEGWAHARFALSASLILVVAGLGWGCGSAERTSTPAPETPTDVREATTIERALIVYRRTTGLIRSQLESCVEALPPGYPKRSCAEDVHALATQRMRQLHGPLEPLRSRLGPRCEPILKRVLALPAGEAGAPLASAAEVCRSEYERAAAG